MTALGQNGEFTLGLNPGELSDIIHNKMRVVSFHVSEEAYAQLSDGNKRALLHLVNATEILDRVFLKQDHPDNIRAKEAFEKACANGDEVTQQAYRLFQTFNGIQGINMYAQQSQPLRIFADKTLTPGRGFYPQDMSKDELIEHVLAHPEQASAIFSNNTIVVREDGRLKAVPYSVFFRDDMEAAARQLLEAAKETDHEGFARYLRWQAQALVNDSDPEMVVNADKTWIDLEDSPLEFTIGRESYDDHMSSDVASDPRVREMLNAYGIKSKKKDNFGARTGIVNRDSYAVIASYREHLDSFGELMPLSEEYRDGGSRSNMTFADVDLVAVSGRYAAIRSGMSVANNLPNDDKLAVQLGSGNRLVFHRQVRQSADPEEQQKLLDALIDPSQFAWYDRDANFRFTVGHELAHSLGPTATKAGQDKKTSLGKWGDIIEEDKADLGSIAMTAYFVEIGQCDPEQANKIYLTWVADQLPTKQPTEDEAHRYRSIMQLNYFREKGAIEFEAGGKLKIYPELMGVVARDMLQDAIRLQLDGDADKAGEFCRKYGAWNEALQYSADTRLSLKPRLYRIIQQPMRDRILELGLSS